MHQPSVSNSLHAAAMDINHTVATSSIEGLYRHLVPDAHHAIFPQLQLTRAAANGNPWPATMLLHGTADTAVPVGESRHLKELLQAAKVPVQLIEFDGQEHSFDYEPDAEELWGERFDGVKNFLSKWLNTGAATISD